MPRPPHSAPVPQPAAVPWIFRVGDLPTLAPERQVQLVQAARREAADSLPVRLALLGAAIGVLSALWRWHQGSGWGPLVAWAVVLPLIGVVWISEARRALARALARTPRAPDPPSA